MSSEDDCPALLTGPAPSKGETMGKIASNFFISLDGVVESPDQWHFPYFNDEMGAAIDQGAATSEAFMMGRVLYEEWASYWPDQDDDEPFAKFINTIPKYVVSNTLDEAAWNNATVVSGDVATEIRQIKEQTDGDIALSGSATLVPLAARERPAG